MNRLLFAVCGAIVLVALFPAPASSFHYGGFHWARTANPLKVDYHVYVGWAWDQWTNDVMAGWSLSSAVDTYSQLPIYGEACESGGVPVLSNGHVKVCEGNYGPGWYGETWVFPRYAGGNCDSCVDGNAHIVKAAMRLNNYYAYAGYQRKSVYCHEAGHALGLFHYDGQSGSCMSNTGFAIQPNQHDYDQLSSAYGHADGYNTSHSVGGGCGIAEAVGVPVFERKRLFAFSYLLLRAPTAIGQPRLRESGSAKGRRWSSLPQIPRRL